MVEPINEWPHPTLEIKRLDIEVEDHKWTLLVAELKGDLVGSVEVTRMNKSCASFRRLFVRKDSRKQGLGGRLVDECCALARAQGLKYMGITAQDKPSLVRFYTNLGFTVGYEQDGELSLFKVL